VLQVLTADVADSNITTAKINDLGVTTGKVAANAITADGAYSNDATTGLSGTEAEIGTVTISTNGGSVTVLGKCDSVMQASGVMTIRLRKDSITGTIIDVAQITNASATASMRTTTTVIGLDTSPSASQTYKLTGTEDANDCSAAYRRMVADNLKK
jgi:hypothetical protein